MSRLVPVPYAVYALIHSCLVQAEHRPYCRAAQLKTFNRIVSAKHGVVNKSFHFKHLIFFHGKQDITTIQILLSRPQTTQD